MWKHENARTMINCVMYVINEIVGHHTGNCVWWTPVNEDCFRIFPFHSSPYQDLNSTVFKICVYRGLVPLYGGRICSILFSALCYYFFLYTTSSREIQNLTFEECQSKPRPAFNSCINREICRFNNNDVKLCSFYAEVSCGAPDNAKAPEGVDKPGDPYCNLVSKASWHILAGGQRLCWPSLSKCRGDSCSDPALLLPACLIFNIVLLAKHLLVSKD